MSLLRRPVDWERVKELAGEGWTGAAVADRFHMSNQWFNRRKITHRDPEIRALFTRKRKSPDGPTTPPD